MRIRVSNVLMMSNPSVFALVVVLMRSVAPLIKDRKEAISPMTNPKMASAPNSSTSVTPFLFIDDTGERDIAGTVIIDDDGEMDNMV